MAEFTANNQPKKKGRKVGALSSKNKLLKQASIDIVVQLIKQASDGDFNSQRLIFEATTPKVKPEYNPINIRFSRNSSLTEKAQIILTAILSGKIDPLIGSGLIDTITAMINLSELDEVITTLEQLKREIKRLKNKTN